MGKRNKQEIKELFYPWHTLSSLFSSYDAEGLMVHCSFCGCYADYGVHIGELRFHICSYCVEKLKKIKPETLMGPDETDRIERLTKEICAQQVNSDGVLDLSSCGPLGLQDIQTVIKEWEPDANGCIRLRGCLTPNVQQATEVIHEVKVFLVDGVKIYLEGKPKKN